MWASFKERAVIVADLPNKDVAEKALGNLLLEVSGWLNRVEI